MESFEHALPKGTLIDGRYRIDSVLGEGGFAITYKAFDTKLHCDVAIKEFLPVELAARSSGTKTVQPRTNRNEDYSFGLHKFLDEARTLAKLQHPNIVQVTNFIETNGTAYLVMTYAEGQELGEWLKTQPGQLSEDAILAIVTPILDGLTRVHQQGLLHRDIKPGNIFLRNVDGPMLIDFGAARHALGEHSKSISAIISQGYAPPEQYVTRGKQTPATDLYAIGATLYHLITGHPPTESVERSHEVHEGEPDPMVPAAEAGKGKVSDWLLALTDQLLAISPRQRPNSAEAVLDAIKNKTTASLDADPVSPQPRTTAASQKTRVVSDVERFSQPVKDNPVSHSSANKGIITGVAIAVTIALAGGGYYISQSPGDTPPTRSSDNTASQNQKPLPQGKAILFVESEPSGAEIYLDAHLLGKTPYQADNLPAGQFELKLIHELSNDHLETITLTDNLVVNKKPTLAKASGNYSIFSQPEGARIIIDGVDTGQVTPSSLTGLEVGQHTLKLSRDAYYPSEQSIYVRKGETLRGDFTLEGGHLVQYDGQWVEPEEKSRLIAEAEANRQKADQDKAANLRLQAEKDAARGDVPGVEKALKTAGQLVPDDEQDAAILARARQVQAELEEKKRQEAEAKKLAEEKKAREEAARLAAQSSSVFNNAQSSVSLNSASLKPYVEVTTTTGSMSSVIAAAKQSLKNQGFEVVGEYSPKNGVTIIAITNAELKANAARSDFGAYGAVLRVGVTAASGGARVTYVNPYYSNAVFRMSGSVNSTAQALQDALGASRLFGSATGKSTSELNKYHYTFGMEYVDEPVNLGSSSHSDMVDRIEANLGRGKAGSKKVYRVDIGSGLTVFGVGLSQGRGAEQYAADELILNKLGDEAFLYLPSLIVVQNGKAFAPHLRFILPAFNPDIPMMGPRSFMEIMPSPDAVNRALTEIAN